MSIELPRRRFLAGLGALIAAPAIVRASSLMPVRGWEQLLDESERLYHFGGRRNTVLTMDMITREALELFKRTNAFIKQIDDDYDTLHGSDLRIGQQLRIRKPDNFRIK